MALGNGFPHYFSKKAANRITVKRRQGPRQHGHFPLSAWGENGLDLLASGMAAPRGNALWRWESLVLFPMPRGSFKIITFFFKGNGWGELWFAMRYGPKSSKEKKRESGDPNGYGKVSLFPKETLCESP